MAASPYLYAATSQKPTGVTHAVLGAFTAPAALNLLLAKTSHVEVHTVTSDGLQPVCDVGLHGRIATLQLVRLAVRDLPCCRGLRRRAAVRAVLTAAHAAGVGHRGGRLHACTATSGWLPPAPAMRGPVAAAVAMPTVVGARCFD